MHQQPEGAEGQAGGVRVARARTSPAAAAMALLRLRIWKHHPKMPC